MTARYRADKAERASRIIGRLWQRALLETSRTTRARHLMARINRIVASGVAEGGGR